jgi:hypothetical protein
MSKTLSSIVVCLLVGWMLSGCGPSQQARATQTAVAQTTATAVTVEAAMAALPMALPKLYVASGNELSPTPMNGNGFSDWGPNGVTQTVEFESPPGDVTLANDCTYQLLLSSPASTSVTAELILRQDSGETVAGKDTFTVESTPVKHYTGKFVGCSTASARNAQWVLRLTESGKGLGIAYGSGLGLSSPMSDVSFITVGAALAVPAGAAKERTKALTWLGTNLDLKPDLKPDRLTDDAHFSALRDELDSVILAGDNAGWTIGWGLTTSKKPYDIGWNHGVFEVYDIDVDMAQRKGISADQIGFIRHR